jgi:hypothetical protein
MNIDACLPSLPPFPVDDITLNALEHALGAALRYIGDEPTLVGAEYDLHQLLDFLSGYDPTQIKVLEEGLFDGDPPPNDNVYRRMFIHV